MYADCHMHMVLDGLDWKQAIGRHRNGVDDGFIRRTLARYRELGFTYLRDGGDRWGVGKRARELAPEYGIDYRTHIFSIHTKGPYGGIVGFAFEDWKEYRKLVQRVRKEGGTFIKIMISGIMDFGVFGSLSEPGLTAEEIRVMIEIAHDAGFAVMAHGNGTKTVSAAIEAGVDTIEHGNYLDEEVLHQLAESRTIWIPTLAPTGNLLGCGRFPDEAVSQILEQQLRNVGQAFALGSHIGLGSDAGAYLVPHGQGILDEVEYMKRAVSDENALRCRIREAEDEIKRLF